MIETVLAFGLINVIFELVLLGMIPPRTRLRLLGSDGAKSLCHIAMLVINLTVHWGTVVGTMSSVTAFIASMGAVKAACWLFGSIKDDRWYTVGIIKYSSSELK